MNTSTKYYFPHVCGAPKARGPWHVPLLPYRLIRHWWHRHDRRSAAVVPSLIAVAPPKTVKTADLRGGTVATFNMFRRASAVLPPSHRRRGATAVLVRHKPQWHRHDRRGSAVIPSLIAVAPPKTVKTADLRGGTAETFNKLPQCYRGLG